MGRRGFRWMFFYTLAAVALYAPAAENDKPYSKETFTYKTIGPVEVQADVYRMREPARQPVLIWVHGGALIAGGRTDVPTRIVEAALKDRYTLVSIDYRLAPEVKIAQIVEDLFDALKWVRERGPELFGADPTRLVVAGESAGGYLTLLCGARADPKPTALLAYYGYGTLDSPWYTEPSEFYRAKFPLVDTRDAEQAVNKGVLTHGGIVEGRGKYYLYLRQNGLWPEAVAGFEESDRAKFTPYCPLRNITADFPPTLLIHGTADSDVPYIESADMAAMLERHGVEHELVTLKDSGHGLIGGDPQKIAEAHAKAQDFIAHHLKPTPPTAGETP